MTSPVNELKAFLHLTTRGAMLLVTMNLASNQLIIWETKARAKVPFQLPGPCFLHCENVKADLALSFIFRNPDGFRNLVLTGQTPDLLP